MSKKNENIFIQWHLTTYGIAYLKHVLSAFYINKVNLSNNISAEKLSQEELNEVFDKPNEKGFVFDKIYYFTATDSVFDELVTYEIINKSKFWDDEIFENNEKLKSAWKEVLEKNLSLEDVFLFCKKNNLKYDESLKMIGQIIHLYKFEEQKKWLLEYSNFQRIYKEDKIRFINMTKKHKIYDLRNLEQLAKAMYKELISIKNRHKDANFIINITHTYAEVQIVWFSFSQAGLLPPTTRFISFYDRQELPLNKSQKFFEIKEVPTKIINQIGQKMVVYDKSISNQRKEVELKIQHYLNQGFAILLMGERGIGKSYIAEKYKKKGNFVHVNCATFTNNTLAESILFGYVKGAFTDAKEDKEGVFEQANGGTLFLDEIHHLDKIIQAKLMKAIQTDENNFFHIRRLGDKNEKKVTCQLIFATNRTIEELRECLLPDFYDRITQLVVELPPLRRTPNEIWEAFKQIWFQLKFDNFFSFDEYVAVDKDLKKWLQNQPLYGNYRDLQRIAIYYKTFLAFDKESKKILREKTPFEFAVNNFQKYSSFSTLGNDLFNIEISPFDNVKLYQKKLAQLIKNEFGTFSSAVEFYKSKKIDITIKTLQNWYKN